MLRYFPLFIRHHWITAILTMDDKKQTVKMLIYDSAPSEMVHRYLRRIFKQVWPTLKIFEVPSPTQQRGTDDCGVFMVANIMADYLKTKINDPFTLPVRLRPLLVKISKGNMHKADALISIRDCLLYKQHKPFSYVLNGGATTQKRIDPIYAIK